MYDHLTKVVFAMSASIGASWIHHGPVRPFFCYDKGIPPGGYTLYQLLLRSSYSLSSRQSPITRCSVIVCQL